MKKSFVSMSLIVFMICISSTYAAEKCIKVKKEVKFGENSICFLRAEGTKEFCETIKKSKQQRENTQISFTFPPGREITAQVNKDGIFTIFGDTKKTCIFVKDRLGNSVLNPEKKNDINDASLDDEEGEKIRLQTGDSVTLRSSLNDLSRIIIKYDKRIGLVSMTGNISTASDKEKACILVLHSRCTDYSELVSVATRSYGNGRAGKTEVFLEEQLGEIQLLDTFLTLNESLRKRLLYRLSITKTAVLLANLDIHNCIEQFGCGFFEYVRKPLKSKIHTLVSEFIGKKRVSCCNEINCLIKENMWSKKAHDILECAMREIIRPIPEILFECRADGDSEIPLELNLDKTRAIVKCKNRRRVIVDISSGDIIVDKHNIELRFLSPDGNYVAVYEGNVVKVVNLENQKTLMERTNVKEIGLSPDGMNVSVIYNDAAGEIIRLEDEVVIYKWHDVKGIYFCSNNEMVEVHYKDDNKKAIISLKHEDPIFIEKNVELIDFDKDNMLIEVCYFGDKREIRSLENGTVLLGVDGVEEMNLSSDGKRLVVHYKNDTGEIINVEDGSIVAEWDDVLEMNLNSDGTKIIVVLQDNDGSTMGEIINLEDGNSTFEWPDVEVMDLNETEKKIIVRYGTDLTEMVNTKNEVILHVWNDTTEVYFNAIGNMIGIRYKDGRGEIMDPKTRNILFSGNDISEFYLDQTDMKVVVIYNDKRRKIIDLKTERHLFEGENIARSYLSSDGKNALIRYKDDKIKIIDLENFDRGIVFTELEPDELRFIFSLINLSSPDDIDRFIKDHYSVWNSFNQGLQKNLFDSYFSQNVKTAIQTMEPESEPPSKKHKESAIISK